jgi:hypothetical protein
MKGKTSRTFYMYNFIRPPILPITHSTMFSNTFNLCSIVSEIINSRYTEPSHTRDLARMGEGRGVCRILVWKPEGKRPLARRKRRWEDNIKMDFQEVECGVMNWIWLARNRDRWRAIVTAVMNIRVP